MVDTRRCLLLAQLFVSLASGDVFRFLPPEQAPSDDTLDMATLPIQVGPLPRSSLLLAAGFQVGAGGEGGGGEGKGWEACWLCLLQYFDTISPFARLACHTPQRNAQKFAFRIDAMVVVPSSVTENPEAEHRSGKQLACARIWAALSSACNAILPSLHLSLSLSPVPLLLGSAVCRLCALSADKKIKDLAFPLVMAEADLMAEESFAQSRAEYPGHEKGASAHGIALSPDAALLATAAHDGTVAVRPVATMEAAPTVVRRHDASRGLPRGTHTLGGGDERKGREGGRRGRGGSRDWIQWRNKRRADIEICVGGAFGKDARNDI